MRGLPGLSKLMGKAAPASLSSGDGEPRPLAGTDAATAGHRIPTLAVLPPAHLARAQRLRANLEGAMDQMQHARSGTEQIAGMLADYEAKARLLDTANARNAALAQELEDERFKAADMAAKTGELDRELDRTREEANRAQEAAAKARKEVGELTLTREREADAMVALNTQINGLQAELDTACEARERAEIEGSGLRAALVERDHALAALQNKESEWRLRAEKDTSRLAELEQAGERKERRIAELSGALENSAQRIEGLEERGERAAEDQRQLEIRLGDLKVSSDSRIFTLSGALSQEQAGHRVTRKLLEEMRRSAQTMTDENKQLKDQAVNLAQENQQMKRELGGTRGTIREYGERLSELNLRYSAAQDDIERLENAATQSKKEARRLKRRSAKVDDLQGENAALHDKIKSLQQTLEQYRAVGTSGGAMAGDGTIVLARQRSGDTQEQGAVPLTGTAPVLRMP